MTSAAMMTRTWRICQMGIDLSIAKTWLHRGALHPLPVTLGATAATTGAVSTLTLTVVSQEQALQLRQLLAAAT